MKKKLTIGLVGILIALIMTLPAAAQEDPQQLDPDTPAPSSETGEMTQDVTGLWFVELRHAPTADGGKVADMKADRAAFAKEAKSAGLGYTVRYTYQTLWNGHSIQLTKGDAAKLTQLTSVKAVYPVVSFAIPQETFTEDPELATALAMTGADIAQNELGYTGEGVRVAIMDTGVDYNHPDLGGCFGAGCRVATGYDFVGDAYNSDPTSAAYDPVPHPDADPDDCNGHGTHVAGIVGASGDPSTGGARGVAPGVTYGAYRVFGCEGSTEADIMLAAMERALADNMQVLNMSIGSAFQWPQYPTGAASTRLVNKGVVVVASIGNSGADGLYSAGSPGLGSKVIGVASYDNSHVQLTTFTISPDNTAIGYGVAAAAPLPPTSGTYPMARTGTTSTPNDACNAVAPPPGSLTGKVVLIRRGTCTFFEKAFNAQNAGAAAVVLYNNVAGRFSPTVAGPSPITIPVVAISNTEGALINSRLAVGPVDMTWTDQTGTFINPTGGLISSFSSYGLSPDLAFKPDIGAPGGLIRSTYPLEKGGYATISGTSMSSPHVAGGAALFLQAHPNTSPQAIDEYLQNSADPHVWSLNPATGLLDHVHRQGAGMLDMDDAILATTHISPSELAVGEGEAGPQTYTLNLTNTSAADVTYDLSYVNALTTGGVITPSFFLGNASVGFSAPSVTVPAGGSASVDATVNPATGPVNGQYGGYIVFTPQGGGQLYRVPYAGFVGNYQGIVAMTHPFGLPWLSRLVSCTKLLGLDCVVGGSFSQATTGAVYTMQSTDVPYVLIHFDHQVRTLRFEVLDSTGKAWHRALNQDYMGRNQTTTSFFAFPWDGTTVAGNKNYVVPDGDYYIVVSALKALGDSNNPADWETWTSPTFTVDRP